MSFILALKLTSCKPVVEEPAISTYDVKYSVTSQSFGDDDKSSVVPVDDVKVNDVKEDFSAQKTKDDNKVEDFWSEHPVNLHDEKFVATEKFKKDYKNTFGYEFNGIAEMSYQELKMLPDDKYFSPEELKEYTEEEMETIRYEEEKYDELNWFKERGYFDEDYDPEDFKGEQLMYYGKRMFTEAELKRFRSGEEIRVGYYYGNTEEYFHADDEEYYGDDFQKLGSTMAGEHEEYLAEIEEKGHHFYDYFYNKDNYFYNKD